MDLRSAFRYTYLLSFFITFVKTQTRTRIGLMMVVPGSDGNTKALVQQGIRDCSSAARSRSLGRQFGITASLRVKNLDPRRNGASEILDIFCNDIFRDVNTIITLNLNNRDMYSLRKVEYTENVAEEFGYPVISYNPSYTGAMEYEKEKLVLQMAPTIYHQAQAILDLLRNFNWTHFSIVSTSEDSYFEFNAAIDSLMKEHEARRKITDKFSYTKLQTMIFPVPSSGDKVQAMVNFLRETNLDENRIYLLHSIRSALDFMDAAKICGLDTQEHVWILTSDSVDVIARRTFFPVGVLGVTHRYPGKFNASIQTALGNAGKIWVTALEKFASDLDKSNALPQFTCDNTSASIPWSYGKELYKYMKNVSIINSERTIGFHNNGLSKYVQLSIVNVQIDRENGYVSAFKQIGQWLPVEKAGSVELKLFIDGIMWPGMKSVPPKGRPKKRFFRISTLQEEPYVMYRSPNNRTGQCVLPAVKCRIMYNSTLHGNDSTVENGTIQWCCTGLSIDLLRIMSERMEFDYNLTEVPDRVCGIQNQKTFEWNGLIRQLQTGETDMVITSLQITPSRATAVDFSMPYLETGTAIIVKLRKDKVSPTAVLEPYDYPAWCLILVFSVHSIGASIFIFEWLSPRGLDQGKTPMREHTFSLFRSFWLIWAMLFQSSVSADNPRGISSRFLGNVWALFALVFLASYTANLAAFMITKDTYYDLTGLEDWRLVKPFEHKPPLKFGTIPNGSTEETLRQYHPFMYKYMVRYNQHNLSTAIKALKNGDLQAFIYDSSPLRYQVGIDDGCTLMETGKPAAMSGYGVAFPKGSNKLIEEVNRIILDLEENGELGRLRNFWLSGPCHKKNRIGQSSGKLGILNFTSAFILLAIGIGAGGVLLFLEHTYFRFGRRCLKKYDKWGCCALVSLSMGKSLTFEQSVMDAVDFCKKHKCKDPLCETQMWKVRHELDLALLKIEKLNAEFRRSKLKAIKSVEKDAETSDKDSGTYAALKKAEAESEKSVKDSGDEDEGHYASMTTPETEEDLLNKQEVVADVNHQQDNFISQRDRNGMRRSPSYNQAVEGDSEGIEPIDNTAKSKTRYNDGKYYQNLNTDEDDGQV